MRRFVVYVDPGTNQFFADGSPVLWSCSIDAPSEDDARQIVHTKGDLRGMPIALVLSR